MEKLMKIKSGNMKLYLLPLAALLIITPLLSTSLKFKYLYLIVNILIISVGADAGLLSFFMQSQEYHRKPAPPVSSLLLLPPKPSLTSDNDAAINKPVIEDVDVEPSIFFIDQGSESGGAQDDVEDDDRLMMEEENNIEDHDLYHKSETFIGNFYKQLKMQREESWNKFHE